LMPYGNKTKIMQTACDEFLSSNVKQKLPEQRRSPKRICSPASNGRFYVNTGKRTNRLGRKYKLRYCRCACLERDGGQAEIIPDYWPHKKANVKFDIGTRKEPTVPPGFMKISVCKGTERVCLETGAVSVVEPHLKNPETGQPMCTPLNKNICNAFFAEQAKHDLEAANSARDYKVRICSQQRRHTNNRTHAHAQSHTQRERHKHTETHSLTHSHTHTLTHTRLRAPTHRMFKLRG
jgi:hypothetical protein